MRESAHPLRPETAPKGPAARRCRRQHTQRESVQDGAHQAPPRRFYRDRCDALSQRPTAAGRSRDDDQRNVAVPAGTTRKGTYRVADGSLPSRDCAAMLNTSVPGGNAAQRQMGHVAQRALRFLELGGIVLVAVLGDLPAIGGQHGRDNVHLVGDLPELS